MITREIVLDDAQSLGVEPDAVLAVAEVESAGSGFLSDGRPAILFEAQWFHHFTGGRYDTSNPQVSSPTWNRALYLGGAREYFRLNEAMALDAEAALESTSWGAFQEMGFNFEACGFPTVTAMVDAMKRSENDQLAAFTAFIRANPGMLEALQSKDWTAFARLYNGPGAVAQYSGRIGAAYQMHARGAVMAPVGLMSGAEGPPIPEADPSGPPPGYYEGPTGNQVRVNVKESPIVKNAGWGNRLTTAVGVVGGVSGTAATVAGMDPRVVLALAVVACVAVIAGLVILLNKSASERMGMWLKGIA